ncbi:MAG TPA: MFS transporter [Candidatus Eisenbacteria bacterium]|nr:MFS transporter [Candidatus Eisenbacteria bacterium]
MNKKTFFRVLTYALANDSTFSLGIFLIYMLSLGYTIFQASFGIAAWLIAQSIGGIITGIFADRYGYKNSMIWGTCIFLSGTICLAAGFSFPLILLGFFLRGLGFSTKQGSVGAHVYETLKEKNYEEIFKKTIGTMDFYINISWIILSILGGFLFVVHTRFPFYAEIILSLACLLSIIGLKEIRTAQKHDSIKKQIVENINYAFKTTQFSKVFFFSALIGSIALITIQYLQPLYRALHIPDSFFGILAAASFLTRGAGSWHSEQLGKLFSIDKYLVLHAITFGLFLLLIEKAHVIILVLPIVGVFYFLRGLYGPTISTYINDKVPSDKRASMLGLNNQILSIATAIVLIGTGYIAQAFGLSAAFFSISIISMTFLFAYIISVRTVATD